MSHSDKEDKVEIETESSSKPDIKVDINNGKHIEIEMDPHEWVIFGVFVLIMTALLGYFGVF